MIGSVSNYLFLLQQHFTRQPNGLGDRRFPDATTPFVNDRIPSHAAGYLVEHIFDKDPRAAKRRFAVANG